MIATLLVYPFSTGQSPQKCPAFRPGASHRRNVFAWARECQGRSDHEVRDGKKATSQGPVEGRARRRSRTGVAFGVVRNIGCKAGLAPEYLGLINSKHRIGIGDVVAAEFAKLTSSVSIVVTALNEGGTIEKVVREASDVAEQMLGQYEFLLVDDGSTDGTGTIMDSLARELPHMRAIHNNRNLGFGASYMRGVGEARFDHVMLLCGDNGLPPSNLPRIIEKIGKADIIIPYMRNLKEIKTRHRYIISRWYTIFLNWLSGYRLHYYNGLPVHRRALVSQIAVKSTGFGFQGEILLKLLKSGCSYVEVGVDGAAKEKQRSVALRPGNILNVARTCFVLLREMRRFEGIPLRSPVGKGDRQRVLS